MKKVVKFGGSSLASAEQFGKVGAIIRADKDRRYVVPSAPGKRDSKDTKVTDMLYEAYALAEKYNATKLVYYENTNNIESAISREKQLKKWKRDWKIKLIKDFNPTFKDLYEKIL